MPNLPEEDLVKQFTENPNDFEKLNAEIKKMDYSEYELEDIYVAFIKINPKVIASIPVDERTRDMYFR